jgi:TonB-dependent SusC/RagA subfamily outer membrane receptor
MIPSPSAVVGRPWVVGLLSAAILAVALADPSPASAQRGVIAGRVLDSASQAPIPDAQVRVAGTVFGTLSRADGTYRIAGLIAGPATVQVLRVGFHAGRRAVTVLDSGTVTADFALTPAATTLDQVVIQATGQIERQRETGNAVGTITLDSVPKAAVASFSDVLSSRAPGVIVTQQSGTTGGTSHVRIRGNSSVSLDNGPLLVIDGVRADNDESASQIDVGGQTTSRLDDLDPNEIEDITVLRGPAAAALYGTAGANGVIQVTTRHGAAGKPVWRAFEEYGSVRNYVSFPANYNRVGVDASSNRTTQCTLLSQAQGGCTPTPDSLVSFSPLAADPPFGAGWRNNFGLDVAGGTDAIGYFANADHKDEHGVYANNYVNRTNGRANLRATLSPTVELSANIGYLQSGLGLPQNDNAAYDALYNGLMGSAFNNAAHGYLLGLGPSQVAKIISTQSVDRYTTSATATWRPLSWFSVVGVTGLDFAQTLERQVFPVGVFPIFPTGGVQTDPITDRQYTTNVTATAHYTITPSLLGTTSVGSQFNDQRHNQLISSAQGLLPGVGSLGGANSNFSITEDNPEEVLFGGLLQQQLAWRDKVFLTAAVRTDRNSAILSGSWTTYPEASLSWVVGEEPFFPRTSIVSSLRVRSAYGESGEPSSSSPRPL